VNSRLSAFAQAITPSLPCDGGEVSSPAVRVVVPLGVAGFAGDFSGVRRFAERDHKNIMQWNLHPEPGGHYAAHLEPAAFMDDLRGCYASLASVA
jgi:epoxide hydrolase